MIWETRGLGVTIAGRPIVAGIDMSIGAGECVALVGASGSGKSQTCLAPFGLAAGVAQGSARFEGIELVGLSERAVRPIRARGVGFVFQQPMTALTPHLTVAAQLAEAWAQAGAARPRPSDLAALLDRVGLAPALLDRYPHRLSGGQRQRVMIAASIAHRPRLLIADEPTSALDAAARGGVMTLLDRLRSEDGLAMLLVSHDLPAVASHATRVIVLEAGQVVEAGDAAALIAAPVARYTRALIAAVPRLDGPLPPRRVAGGPLIAATGITVRFPGSGWRGAPVTAVADASLTIGEGEAVALVGASGSGKSTLGRALARLGPIDAGVLSWRGAPVAVRVPPRLRSLVQPVFQDPVASLEPRWKVRDIVAEPLRALRPELDAAGRRAAVAAALDAVELESDYLDRRPATLSGGQAQRVAIARALVVSPALLLLDEATSALDVLVAGRILALLASLRAERGLALLFITHEIAAARALCDRIAVMDAGRIVEDRAAAALVADPHSAAARTLIAAARA